MNLNVGDIIEFPKHAESTLLRANTASVMLSQGAPGHFEVTSIKDGVVHLKLLPNATAPADHLRAPKEN